MLAVNGGWIRWSTRLQRADAHCGMHKKCKVDRTVKQGSLGLSLAWLKCCLDLPDIPCLDHKIEVEALSAAEGKPRREQARAEFEALAAAAGPATAEAQILKLEKIRNSDEHEPEMLQCRGLASALLRAACAG